MEDDFISVVDQPRHEWLRSTRWWIAVASVLLVAGTALAVTGVLVEQRAQKPAQERLRTELRPAQVQVERLVRGYDDQETGLRGYLLTGRPETLEPYDTGRADVRRLMAGFPDLIGHDDEAMSLLADVQTQADEWRRTIAVPQIAARERGPVPQARATEFVGEGKESFDVLRSRVSALSTRVNDLISAELARFDDAQSAARTLQRSALAMVLLAATVLALVAWQMGRPLRRLVDGVDAVAAGDYRRAVPQGGPQEFAKLGRAVESMRASLVDRSEELAGVRQEIVRLEEQERIADELQNLTIQHVFALGLRLSSLASAGRPVTQRELQCLVDETDAIIDELRRVIFPQVREPEPAARVTAPS